MTNKIETLRELEVLNAKKDPYFFLTEICITKDEHDAKTPYKPFPKKKYIKFICEIFREENKVMVEKSRQLMYSWMTCALILWDVMFHRAKHWFIVSKKENDSDKLLGRIDHIYEHLPPHFKDEGYEKKYCKLTFGGCDGVIEAVSQNPDAMRQNVASGVFVDEAEFHDDFQGMYEAIRPTIDGGGKLVTVSSVNGKGPVYKMMTDQLDF